MHPAPRVKQCTQRDYSTYIVRGTPLQGGRRKICLSSVPAVKTARSCFSINFWFWGKSGREHKHKWRRFCKVGFSALCLMLCVCEWERVMSSQLWTSSHGSGPRKSQFWCLKWNHCLQWLWWTDSFWGPPMQKAPWRTACWKPSEIQSPTLNTYMHTHIHTHAHHRLLMRATNTCMTGRIGFSWVNRFGKEGAVTIQDRQSWLKSVQGSFY